MSTATSPSQQLSLSRSKRQSCASVEIRVGRSGGARGPHGEFSCKVDESRMDGHPQGAGALTGRVVRTERRAAVPCWVPV